MNAKQPIAWHYVRRVSWNATSDAPICRINLALVSPETMAALKSKGYYFELASAPSAPLRD